MATFQAAVCSNVAQLTCNAVLNSSISVSSRSSSSAWLCPRSTFCSDMMCLSSVSSFSQSTSALQKSWIVSQIRRASLKPAAARAAAGGKEQNVLLVNANSGGHAVIGFYFAKDLRAAGFAVTILTVGEESSDKMKKPPFSRFSELKELGVQTVWGSPADVGAAIGTAKFDVVLDNNGKDLDSVKPVADWAKASGVKQFLFISSAGIYKSSDEPPHVEGDSVEDAGHAEVEKYVSKLGFNSWSSFRPQYMIGSGNNKDCEEYFFDRIVRGRPILIPEPGIQLTNISHVSDLSSMLTLAAHKPEAANGQLFNCVSDRAVTLAGIARLCAKAAGKEVEIITYDPKATGVDVKKAFPFRPVHFYAEPRAAKELLGWTCKTNLPEDLKERYAEYISIGRDKKDIKFELDDKILAAVKQPVLVTSAAIRDNGRSSRIQSSSDTTEGTEEEELEYLGELRVPQAWVEPEAAAREAEWLRVALHQWLDDEFCPEPANEEISKRCSKVYYYCLLEQQLDVGDILMQMVSGLETFSFKESFHGAFSSANAAIDLITRRMRSFSLEANEGTESVSDTASRI